MYSKVEDFLECPTHADSFKTGEYAAPWCGECRKLFKLHSKQRPRSRQVIKMKSKLSSPKEVSTTSANVTAVFQVVNREEVSSQSTEVWNITNMTTSQNFHFVVGPVPDTSEPSFVGECPAVSYLPNPMSPTDMLTEHIIQQVVELINLVVNKHLPYDPTHIMGLHTDRTSGF